MLKLLSCAKVATIHNYNILKFSIYDDAIFVHSQVTTMRSRRLHDMYFSSCCSLVLAIEVFYGCLSNYEKKHEVGKCRIRGDQYCSVTFWCIMLKHNKEATFGVPYFLEYKSHPYFRPAIVGFVRVLYLNVHRSTQM